MKRNTSIALSNYFEELVENRISEGRYKNASEVIRARLRLLEEEENRVIVLKASIKKGLESGVAKDFNSKIHLASLKANKRNINEVLKTKTYEY